MQIQLTLRGPSDAQAEADVEADVGVDVDVEITAPSGATLSDVSEQLCSVANLPLGTTVSGAAGPMPFSTPLGSAELRSGALLVFGRAARRIRHPVSVLRLAITGGPDAGRVLPLGPGRLVIGRDDEADVQLIDVDVSRRHAELVVDEGTATLRDLASTNGTTLGDVQVGPDPERSQSIPSSTSAARRWCCSGPVTRRQRIGTRTRAPSWSTDHRPFRLLTTTVRSISPRLCTRRRDRGRNGSPRCFRQLWPSSWRS